MIKLISYLINFISKLFGKNKPKPKTLNHLPDEDLLRYKQLEMEDEEESTSCTYVPNQTESPKTLSYLLDAITPTSSTYDNASVVDLLDNIFNEEDKPKFTLLLKILKNMPYGDLEDVIYSTYDPEEVKDYLYEEPFVNFRQTLVNLAEDVMVDHGYILDNFIVEEFNNLVEEIFEVVLDEKEEVDFNALKNLSDAVLVPVLTTGTFPEED